jgi:hypothetical protein
MENPNPEKFYMSVAHGVKAEARADAPDVEVPFCLLHKRWPCFICGTSHFEGCQCPYCEPPVDPPMTTHERAQLALDEAFANLRTLRELLRKLKS